MKYYIIAGEASGDLHSSNLISGIKKEDKNAVFRGWGGDKMQEEGCEIVKHYKETAIMGLVRVLTNLKKIKNNIYDCTNDIINWKPDVLILVDYGGFNLRIAKNIKSMAKDIPIFYYILPKLWAWNSSRVKSLKKYVDRLYIIFPFEKEFYKRFNLDAKYYGNPLVDAIENRKFKEETTSEFKEKFNLSGKPIISILAGSRHQELKDMLPIMLKVADLYTDYEFVIAAAPSMTMEDYIPYLNGRNTKLIFGNTYRILQHSTAALVTSGTATLETALMKTPQVVCYKGEGGRFSYWLFKTFVKVKYISLVNIIGGKEIVTELLMHKLNFHNLTKELNSILPNGNNRERNLKGYEEVIELLGGYGASDRFGADIVKNINTKLDK